MSSRGLHRFSGWAMLVLATLALLLVLWGYTLPPETDEGTPAHLFQLAVAAWTTMFLASIATLDWRRLRHSALVPAVATALMALAFVALYILEHRG